MKGMDEEGLEGKHFGQKKGESVKEQNYTIKWRGRQIGAKKKRGEAYF